MALEYETENGIVANLKEVKDKPKHNFIETNSSIGEKTLDYLTRQILALPVGKKTNLGGPMAYKMVFENPGGANNARTHIKRTFQNFWTTEKEIKGDPIDLRVGIVNKNEVWVEVYNDLDLVVKSK